MRASCCLLLGFVMLLSFRVPSVPAADQADVQRSVRSDGVPHDERKYAGLIEEISGAAELRESETAAPMPLDPAKDRYRNLYSGEQVRCRTGGRLKLRLALGQPRLISGGEWFTIPEVFSQAKDSLVQAYLATVSLGAARFRGQEGPGTPTGAEPVKRALLVGINTYHFPTSAPPLLAQSAREGWRDLDGCVNDVLEMREVLMARFGFQPENITLVTNNEATRDRILGEFYRNFVDLAHPGDIGCFFYAGHGSQVRNSKTDEPSAMDQSIVPADATQGAWDIRDKEWARMFNLALRDKQVRLTAIFDSCHSGNIARGAYPQKSRDLASDAAQAVADPPVDLFYSNSGLFMSAALDTQLADEKEDEHHTPHGAFSVFLLKSLRTLPASSSAEQVFLSVKSQLQQDNSRQEPTVMAIDRLKQPLFSVGGGGASGVVLGVRSSRNGRIELQGGLAAGLQEGCELKKIGQPANAPALRIRITQVDGLSRSYAEALDANTGPVRPGDLFEVDRWVVAPNSGLCLWVPGGNFSQADLEKAAGEIAALRRSGQCQWVDDPTVVLPTHVVLYDKSSWSLTAGTLPAVKLGKTLEAKTVLKHLASVSPKPRLFVHLPPPGELAKQLSLGEGTAYPGVHLVASPAQAKYLLAGRWMENHLEYAWMLPNLTREQTANCPLPLRTDWLPLEANTLASVAQGLREKALTILRVQSWLSLQVPPDSGGFPYHLALRNLATGQFVKSGDTVVSNETYQCVLRCDPAQVASLSQKRFVYVFCIDSSAQSNLLFGGQNELNQYPYSSETELPLGNPFGIGEPFGVDTYFLLTTATAIPNPGVLKFDRVLNRGQRNEPATPLEDLLMNVGDGTRGAGPMRGVPKDWSIERLALKSIPGS
jgi:hypothetical protein